MIEFSDEDLQKAVRIVIEKIRPYLLKDGGNIEVLGVKSMKIYVALEELKRLALAVKSL